MPSTTPKYALPYPGSTDTADVPRDIQALATRLEVVIPRPLARVSKGAQAGIPGGQSWVITFPTVDVDDLGAYSAASPGKLTAPVAGWYNVGVAASLGLATPADVLLAPRLGGPVVSPPYGIINRSPDTAGLGWVGAAGGPLLFAAGQWLELVLGAWGIASFDVSACAMWLEKIK